MMLYAAKLRMYSVYRSLFARKAFFWLNRILYQMSLRGMGILNHENNSVSGEQAFLTAFLGQTRNAVVFDVGANVGTYSVHVLKNQPTAHVYAFEPHPVTFRTLDESARKLGYSAIRAGCGAKRTRATLYDYADNDGSAHATLYRTAIEDLRRTRVVGHTVRLIRLDDFVRQRHIDFVDLVKIDVEGNELNVLKGFHSSIAAGKVGCMHFEFNEMNVLSRTFFIDFANCLPGYSFHRMLPHGLLPLESYSALTHEVFGYKNLVALLDSRGPRFS